MPSQVQGASDVQIRAYLKEKIWLMDDFCAKTVYAALHVVSQFHLVHLSYEFT